MTKSISDQPNEPLDNRPDGYIAGANAAAVTVSECDFDRQKQMT